MKRKKVIKSLIIVALIAITLFTAYATTYAAINSEYGSNSEVQEPDLEKKMKNSILLDAIASFIYALGSFVENVVGVVFKSLTGTNMFPWADRIIFNTIPLLDVNFLNPSQNSLFLTGTGETVLGTVVRNTYYTVMSLAIAFFGITVAIMAIKLATSTIAAQKAQYQQAITRWLFSIIMLFIMHFVMSFIFYINEQMVLVASGLVSERLSLSTEDSNRLNGIFSATVNDDQKKTVVNEFTKAQSTGAGGVGSFITPFLYFTITDKTTTEMVDYLNKNYKVTYAVINKTEFMNEFAEGAGDISTNPFKPIWDGLTGDPEKVSALYNVYNAVYMMIEGGTQMNNIKTQVAKYPKNGDVSVEQMREYMWENKKYFYNSKFYNSLYLNSRYSYYENYSPEAGANGSETSLVMHNNEEIVQGKQKDFEKKYDLILIESLGNKDGIVEYHNRHSSQVGPDTNLNNDEALIAQNKEKIKKNMDRQMNLYKWMVELNENIAKGVDPETSTVNSQDIIANMAEFFKKTAFTYEVNGAGETIGWRASKLTLQGAILYAIFVFQSVLYFFAYIKRFFYIVVLALIAPVIVVFDFLGKSLS